MQILLTGATGYVGKRLLPILVQQGHDVICCVGDKQRFFCPKEFEKKVKIIEVDFLKKNFGKHPQRLRCRLLFNSFHVGFGQ